MRRQHPLLSPVALGATVLLLLLLGVALYVSGGRAFSPGALSAVAHTAGAAGSYQSHADFGDDCTQCHLPLEGLDEQLCLDCHQEIDVGGDGLHGQLDQPCADCHREHQGADVDLVVDALSQFSSDEHQRLFALRGAHWALDCADCHQDGRYAGTARTCSGCHAEPPLHENLFGTACANCHLESAWQPAQMQTHPFPLDHGGLGDDACLACHGQRYQQVSCATCHADSVIATAHAGLALTPAELADCSGCHQEATAAETERLRNQ